MNIISTASNKAVILYPIVHTGTAGDARDKLLSSLRLAIQSPSSQVGSMLMDELRRSRARTIDQDMATTDETGATAPEPEPELASGDPPAPHPPRAGARAPDPLA